MRMLCLAMGISLAACSHSPSVRAPASDADFMPPKIIDAHAHLVSVWNAGAVDEFTRNKVVGVVSHAPETDPTPAKPTRTFPFQTRICAGISPAVSAKQVEAALKDGRVTCLKIYLGYVKRWAADPIYRPFYRLADKWKAIVVFHTGDTYDKMAHVKYADPLTIDEIATEYPKVRFILAHAGNPWIESAAEVVYKNDNVFVDVSALMLDDVSSKNPETVDALIVKPLRWMWHYVENPKKFLFGTDWPLAKIGPYMEAVKKAFPREHWKAIFYHNAAELFGFQETAD
jgi:hypothetical protein